MSMLTLSPLAQSLFAHAICESGTILVPGVVLPPAHISKQVVSQLANIPGRSASFVRPRREILIIFVVRSRYVNY